MTSLSERIQARIATALAPTTGINGRVFRERWEPLAREEMPAIVIWPISEVDDIPTTGPMITELTVEVNLFLSGSGMTTALDATRVNAHSRLMAEPFTGLNVIHCYPVSRDWRAEAGQIGIMVCRYRVAYRTQLANLEA